jgi:hypothetical protein
VQKVTYRHVADEMNMIKALVTVFSASGMLPMPDDILFCTESTAVTHLEAFI